MELFDKNNALVEVFGETDTIQNHLDKAMHYNEVGEIDYFTVGGKMIPREYLSSYKKMLWCKYLKKHSEIDPEFLPKELSDCFDFIKTEEGQEFSELLKAQDLMVINKDIFLGKQDIVCHQVNCQGVMGRGIAKTIRERFPECFEEYKITCDSVENKKDLLGRAFIVDCGDKMIANLFAQETYGASGCYTDYEAFKNALLSVKDEAKELGLSISIPYGIGASLAGGDWNIISRIIKEVFFDYPVVLYRI